MAQEVEIKIKVVTEGAEAGLNKISTGIAGTNTAAKGLNQTLSGSKQSEFINSLGDGIGKLNPAFGSAVKGANGLILKMWEMVANPVGAILAGIVITAKFLYEAFQDSVAGGKELNAAFAGISAVGAEVKSALFGLGRALIDVASAAYKFITLDFAGAAEDMRKAGKEATDAQNQLGDALDGTTFKTIQGLEKRQQANDKAAKLQAVTQANTDKLLVKSREILTDEFATFAQKKKALAEVTAAETASSKEKLRIAQENLNIKKDEQKAYGVTTNMGIKMNQDIRDATIARDQAEQETAQTGVKLNKQKKMLGRQEMADNKEKNDKIAENNKAVYDADKLALEEKLKQDGLNFQQRRELILNDKMLTAKDSRKFLAEINKEEKKVIEEHKKDIENLVNGYEKRAEDASADTAQKKLDLQMQRQLKEIDNTKNSEEEKARLMILYKEEYNRLQTELNTKAEKESALKKDKEYEDKIKDKDLSLQERQDAIDAEAILIQTQFDNKILSETEHNEKLKILSEARKTLAQLETEAKNKALDSYGQSLSAIGGMLGESTAAGKAASIAGATISTYLAANKAYESQLVVGDPTSPFRGALAAGVAIASGLMNVQKILSVKVPGGGGGGGGAPSISAPASSMPSFNVVGASGANQIAQGMAGNNMPPVQAYVVAGAVTTAQGLNRNIINNASMG